ncbi:uracil-xanthine permease family protein [Cupriavidus cauae]|uniref:Uracil-xanthine permease n=1 Tax=Cupriavidus cauae TaxID=2608999 RepID=A0A5M8ABW5_9BURK|nr:uracil-xanthine permease family protein [Cupriavidus cauae]KAA6120179.1 uracil-xanthine permease [Cupriavidus cauae]UZN48366.1 uracil-xanthine permease family protein [Cupriavidus cauae]
MTQPAPAAVDEVLPWRRLFAFGMQHVLVMAASPIASVFLMSKALNFPAALAMQLLSATFVICGLGTLLQSFGPKGIGARLPFIMLPGGAPIVLFILIAQQTDVQTAAGAVILTGVFYFLVLPVFRRCLRYFPAAVVGTMLLLVAINLAQVSGKLIAGQPGTPGFGAPMNLLLAFATIAFTVLFSRVLTGMLGQLAILLGLLGGALVAVGIGAFHSEHLSLWPVLALPSALPFGMPKFDLIAAIPLMVFSIVSMVEATGQTIAIGDAVGKPIDEQRDVPRTIRGDALTSLLGGLFGTSLIITSGENIGIVRATGVRSRFVTAVSGGILVVFGLLAPVSSLIAAIPEAVVGGTGLIVFCIVGTMGIDMLRKVDLRDHANMYIVAVALAVGLLPILVPGIYASVPANIRILVGNGVAMGAITAALMNFLFFHTGLRRGMEKVPVAH